MALTYRFSFPLPNGLHARPASHLAELAQKFASAITLHNETRDTRADLKSVLSMVSADVRDGSACSISIKGVDEQKAYEALTAFIINTLPTTDEPLPEAASKTEALDLPRSLSAAGLTNYVRGLSVSRGVAIGAAVQVRGAVLPEAIASTTESDPSAELKRFDDALRRSASRLSRRSAGSDQAHEADVVEAHRALLNDPELRSAVETRIRTARESAAQAVLAAGRGFVDKLAASESAYLRERVFDLKDVLLQLLASLGHAGEQDQPVRLSSPSICIADHLTPGQLLSMDATLLNGLVLSHGGTTSHTVILARARGIPMLVDAAANQLALADGQEVVVDAELGLVAPLSTSGVRRYYELETRRLELMRQRNSESLRSAALPIGGAVLEVGANISSAEEVGGAIKLGADGVGLFRTEMLFLGRERAPTEEEQFEAYVRALADAAGQPVIIRTFDIGGDKPAPYLRLPREANPFLGNRGVRLYESHPKLIRDQLRALLRAGSHGQLKILVPMIATVDEVRNFRSLLSQVHRELAGEGATDVSIPPLGVMIEVPSAAMIVPQLSREVDFFSIGSNDLTQYLLAADRDNPAVGTLYGALHPSLWKMLAAICDDAREAGRWTGLCGELGDDTEVLPLLVGLGLDEISTSATRVGEIKRRVRSMDRAACAALLQAVTRADTSDDVAELLRQFRSAGAGGAMLDINLIELDSQAESKEEAIKQLVDRLWVQERASDPKIVERAIWTREESYSTGFGYGCAIPHCKSSAVTTSSVAVLKLRRPVIWNSDGTNEVDLVIMLALREQDHTKQHMRVLAQLSRLLMRDEFRETIRTVKDPSEMLGFLNESLNL